MSNWVLAGYKCLGIYRTIFARQKARDVFADPAAEGACGLSDVPRHLSRFDIDGPHVDAGLSRDWVGEEASALEIVTCREWAVKMDHDLDGWAGRRLRRRCQSVVEFQPIKCVPDGKELGISVQTRQVPTQRIDSGSEHPPEILADAWIETQVDWYRAEGVRDQVADPRDTIH